MNKFILFDFDGVIVDSFEIAFSVKNMMCPSITREAYRALFEGNINDTIMDDIMHDDKCRHDLDFNAEYIPKIKEQVQVFSGMKEAIQQLAISYNLVIISSTDSALVKEVLERDNLAKCFKEIFGNDVHKSKVEKIKMVFSKFGVTSGDCVFVTDTLGDMREAEKMKIGSIGVSWGFQQLETLKKGNSFKIVDRPDQLVLTIAEYFNSLN